MEEQRPMTNAADAPEEARTGGSEAAAAVPAPEQQTGAGDQAAREAISHPAKVMRIGSMIRQLLDEVRREPLDEAGRSRMADIHAHTMRELRDSLSDDLQQELDRLTQPFTDDAPPSHAELRVAQAQLVGWLEGLFHGIQATLFMQQMEARDQLEELRRRSLPASSEEVRSGTYL